MKKILKKILKITAWTLGAMLLLGTVTYFVMDEKLPVGVEGPEAEALTDKMLAAINKPAYDSLHYLGFTSFRGHQYLWDKQRNLVEIQRGKDRLLLRPDSLTGVVFEDGKPLAGDALAKEVEKGITAFWNDGFWLYAPFKVRDPGTKHAVVTDDEGHKSLLVTYGSGGRTPGDHYLWHLDADGRPNAWQLWTHILPIGGLRLGWGEWVQVQGGAWMSIARTTKLKDLHFKDVKGGQSYSDFGRQQDPFAELLGQ